MIRKTALLTGVAGALMFAAPALAQEIPTDDPMAQAPVEQPMAEPEASGSVAPGAEVRAADGATLGILEGAGVDASGQQTLQIRTADGQLREAPIDGAGLDGGAVVLAWTAAEFEAAPAVTDATSNVAGEEQDLTTPAEPAETEVLPEEGEPESDW
ncbi:MAG: superoxide dismutase [Brevundimonas sp.]|uniref:superoxide dismutase n=1 Tax=Brevundimonas sp. TaxID=1871086 RepID=UPI003918861D